MLSPPPPTAASSTPHNNSPKMEEPAVAADQEPTDPASRVDPEVVPQMSHRLMDAEVAQEIGGISHGGLTIDNGG